MSKSGFALLGLFYKIDRMPYFDIRNSVFDIRYSLFQSFFCDQSGRFFGQRRADPPAERLKPPFLAGSADQVFYD